MNSNKILSRQFEDTYTLSKLEEIFTCKRGRKAKFPRQNSSVILVLSGGLDSVCLWDILMKKYGFHVYPIYYIDHKIKGKNNELKSIRYFSEIFKKKYPTLWNDIFIKDYSFSFSFSSLKKNKTVQVDLPTIFANLLYVSDQDASIPSLIDAPSRLGIYVFGAFEYAHLLRARKYVPINTIFLGLTPEDGMSVRESTLSVLRSINLTLCLILGDFNWQILAPIDKKSKFYFNKIDLVSNALNSKLPIDKTWSCRAYNDSHCGICFNCISRKEAFKKLKFKDSTRYTKSETTTLDNLNNKLQRAKNYFNKIQESFTNQPKVNSKISSESRVIPTRSTSWHEIKNKMYIMNQNNNTIESFNSVGAFIWKEIVAEPPTLSALITKVTLNYRVNKLQATKDLKLLLLEMEAKGYIKIK